MSPKRRLSQNITSSARKLKLDSINKILKIDSVKAKRQRKDAISRQISRVALAEFMKNSPQSSRGAPPDFKTFLMHKENVEIFAEFLRASYCEENLDFYLACERYRNLDPDRVGKQMVKFMATQIYNDFLKEGARQPVNVDSECIENIKAKMKDPPPDLLRDAQAEIFNLMKSDCYPRFCRTWQLDKETAQKILSESANNRGPASCPQQASILTDSLIDEATQISEQSSRRQAFHSSDSSNTSTANSNRHRHTTNSSTITECPPECPYFRIGRLPCQEHRGTLTRRIDLRASKIGPDFDQIDHVIDLKKIHKVPESCRRTKRSPPPPPLPPKPDDIDYTRVKTNKPYLPYVGRVFDV